MKKLFLFTILALPVLAFSQARLVINGATKLTIVENGGTIANPIYLEINNPAPNAITNVGGNLGWIVSESEFNMVKWDIGVNAGTYVLPFGYLALDYIPLTVKILAAGAPAAGTIKFSTYHTLADNWTCCPPSDVTNMAPVFPALSQPSITDDSWWVVDRFWIIDANTGYATKPSPNIKFTYVDGGVGTEIAAPNVFVENTLWAQRFNSGISSWGDYFGTPGTDAAAPPTGTAMNDPALALAPADFFRSWTLSSQTSPLPIQLSAFNVDCNNGEALITWTTQTETNNDHFTVERSLDGINYETVATVKGAGNSSTPITYSATDADPLPGTSYYRLSQTDYDGKTTHNTPIAFKGCQIDGTTISAFNSNGSIVVRITAPDADNYDVMVANTLGQIIHSEVKNLPAGYSEFTLNPSNLSYGLYILNIHSNKAVYSKKLLLGSM